MKLFQSLVLPDFETFLMSYIWRQFKQFFIDEGSVWREFPNFNAQ